MQVIFIHHSCFLVEVDEKVLIFDWFAGDRGSEERNDGEETLRSVEGNQGDEA